MRLTVFALVLTFLGCDCGQRTTQRFAQLEILDAQNAERTSVDFGKVQRGTSGTQVVRVRNSGPADLTISKAEFSSGLFGVGTTLPATVGVAEELQLELTYTPTTVDLRDTGTVTLSTNDPNRLTAQLSLAGTGVAAVALVEPAALDFGEVYLTERKTLTVSLTNTGSNDLDVQGAALVGAPASVTFDATPLVKRLKAGESASTTVTFAPTAPDMLVGALELTFPAALGKTSVPLRGLGIQAVPRLCWKFDDSAFEQCTDATTTSLGVSMGSLCDARWYPPDAGERCPSPDGGSVAYARAGTLYVRNEGNTPVTYSVRYESQVGPKCDGGSTVDFEFSNNDAGLTTWMQGNTRLPQGESAPIAITYRARSACREDAADQARVLWTRQGEPAGSNRPPSSFFLSLTGGSLLPRGVPQDITMSGTLPLKEGFFGVGSAGEAPLRVTDISLYQAAFLADGGRSAGPDLANGLCDPLAQFDCRLFSWDDGGVPALPRTLAGTSNTSVPVKALLGRIVFGAGSTTLTPGVEYTVFAVITTSDPYSPQVVSRVRATRSGP
jgi:hypothetical protein